MYPDLIKKLADRLIAERHRSAERARLPEETVSVAASEIQRDLVDWMIELYCDWRAECAAVQATYERFLGATALDRATSFAAYIAALDREQSACESYADQVRLIEAHCAAGSIRASTRETTRSDSGR